MSVSWVYKLTKDQLIAELAKFNFEGTGTVATLRQQLVSRVREQASTSHSKEDDPNYEEERDRKQDLLLNNTEIITVQPQIKMSVPVAQTSTTQPSQPHVVYVTQPDNQDPMAKVLDIMRKWNCVFEGKNLYSFLERVNELKTAYALSDAQILQGFPELLRGDAQLWLRNAEGTYNTWSDLQDQLRAFYLPSGEQRNLDRQIHERKQNNNEGIHKFVTALCTLMRRRENIDMEKQIDNSYKGCEIVVNYRSKKSILAD